MYAYRQNITPPVVKNLIIANCVALLATTLLPIGDELLTRFALFNVESPMFHSYQLFTYMFLHGGVSHLFFNMFALWMFGRDLELEMGSKRFLVYYFVCGVGAAIIQQLMARIDLAGIPEQSIAYMQYLCTPTVGASGAVFGLLLAFGMFHPNATIMLLFPPIPMKAKWFVIVYGLVELFFGMTGRMDSVAHFAHIGGMFWGWLLIMWWRYRDRRRYY